MEENSQNLSQPTVQNTSEQVPTAPPPDPTSDKPKSKLSLLIIGIVIFLLLIGITSAGFFLFPKSNTNQDRQEKILITPQHTAPITPSSTKTYTNDKYGYLFSYPKDNFQLGQYDNQILQESPTEGKYMYVYGCLSACEAYSSGFGVYSYENLNKWDLNMWLNSSVKAPLRKSDNPLDNLLTECINKDPRTKRTIGTFQGKNSVTLEFAIDTETVKMKNEGTCDKETFIGGGGGNQKWVIFENKGKIIAIQMNYTDENEKTQLEKILSTFTLTD